jgi:DNA-directed RNA polymerase I subunit RPA43
MSKTKNHYIKYTRLELQTYCKHPETCIKKVNCIEPIRFSPTILGNFKDSILRILSRKIGKYDNKLNGVVLDFRDTKIMATQTGIRQDSSFSVINVETNFYIFSPRKGAIIPGTIKYINRMSMETNITVVIYRVFNVKVTIKGKVKQELDKNSEIQIRVKDFHFENVIPFIEGEQIIYSMQSLKFIKFVFVSRRDCW